MNRFSHLLSDWYWREFNWDTAFLGVVVYYFLTQIWMWVFS